MPSRSTALERITIVLPVRDEGQRLGAAVEHALAAMDRWESAGPGMTRLVLVLDSCTDDSEHIAARAAAADQRVSILTTNARCVGVARSLGVGVALAGIERSCLHRQWIASTDADTRVPSDWLEVFAEAAESGADALLGTVEPDVLELGSFRYAQWRQDYMRRQGHPHIHGANLGVRASAYHEAGGFPPLTCDEDVGLVAALRSLGADVRSSAKLHVVTSGRLDGRASHGFAAYLACLPSTPSGQRLSTSD